MDNKSHHFLGRLMHQNFIVGKQGDHGVWSLFDKFDLIRIENERLFRIEAVKGNQKRNLWEI